MDIRLRLLRVAARPDRSGGVALADRRALVRHDRAEMRERDHEPVGGRDRDRLARRRDGSGERDCPGRGCDDSSAGVRADVDPAVLPAAVRARRVEDEWLQDGPVGGPCPRPGHWGECENGEGENDDDEEPPPRRRRRYRHGHKDTPVVDSSDNVQLPYGCSYLLSKKITELSQSSLVEVISGHVRESGDNLCGHTARGSRSDEIRHGFERGRAVGVARAGRRR